MSPEIIDNFLTPNAFKELQILLLGEEFPWFYMDKIDYPDDEDKFQFTHSFLDTPAFYDGAEEEGAPYTARIFNFISNPYRIKANLIPRTAEIKVGKFHTDVPVETLRKIHTTSILYINTNNGYTEFKNGPKIESVANRFVTFPTIMEHRGTSCTDKKIRVVINFNYRGSGYGDDCN